MEKSSKICFNYTDFVEAEFGGYLTHLPSEWDIHNRLKDPKLKKLNICALSHRSLKSCPYCNEELLTVIKEGPPPINTSSNRPEHLVKKCSLCGWWFYDYCLWGYIDEFYSWNYYEGVLKKFDISAISVPLNILKKQLTKKFEDIRQIHPRKFEEICKDIFESYRQCEVIHTSYTKDNGIDLYAIKSKEEINAIQVKRRSKPITEGIEAVREFLGAMILNNKINGIYVTTADHFSKDAKQAIISPPLKKYGIKIELIDYHKLLEIFRLSHQKQREPWDDLLTRNYYCNNSDK